MPATRRHRRGAGHARQPAGSEDPGGHQPEVAACRHALHHRLGAAEPGALAAGEVAGHRRLLVEDALRPLARLLGPLRLLEELGVVDRQLRGRGQGGRLLEPRLRVLVVPEPGADVGEEAGGAVEVVLRILGDDAREVGDGGGQIVERQRGEAAAIVRIDRRGARRDRAVVELARLGRLAVLEVEVGQLFEVSRRRVVDDDPLELADPPAPREDLEACRAAARRPGSPRPGCRPASRAGRTSG